MIAALPAALFALAATQGYAGAAPARTTLDGLAAYLGIFAVATLLSFASFAYARLLEAWQAGSRSQWVSSGVVLAYIAGAIALVVMLSILMPIVFASLFSVQGSGAALDLGFYTFLTIILAIWLYVRAARLAHRLATRETGLDASIRQGFRFDLIATLALIFLAAISGGSQPIFAGLALCLAIVAGAGALALMFARLVALVAANDFPEHDEAQSRARASRIIGPLGAWMLAIAIVLMVLSLFLSSLNLSKLIQAQSNHPTPTAQATPQGNQPGKSFNLPSGNFQGVVGQCQSGTICKVCPKGQQCQSVNCPPGNASCTIVRICQPGDSSCETLALPACQTGQQCSQGATCQAGQTCVYGGACAAGDTCVNGGPCVAGQAQPCVYGGTCQAGDTCVYVGTCVTGETCGGPCVAGETCTYPGTCVAGETCVYSGTCVAGETCVYTGTCVAGATCGPCPSGSTCQPCPKGATCQPCATGAACQSCPSGATCQPCPSGATCVPCQAGQVCGNCPTGATCGPCPTGITCQPCPAGATCSPCPTGATCVTLNGSGGITVCDGSSCQVVSQSGAPPVVTQPTPPPPTPTPTPSQKQSSSPPQLPKNLGQLFLIALIAVLAAILLIAILRFLKNRNKPADEELGDLPPEAVAAPDEPPLPDSVRAYYRALLQAAVDTNPNLARRASETPVEYAGRLRAFFATEDGAAIAASLSIGEADVSGMIDDLTRAYITVRYRGDADGSGRATRFRDWLPRFKRLFVKPKPEQT